MIIFARCALSSIIQEKLLVKFSRQYHAPMKITFADNEHKSDPLLLRHYIYIKWSALMKNFSAVKSDWW